MLLYIHIPYCDSKCNYCAFNSYIDRFDTRAKYMEALRVQIMSELERFEVKEGEIETLFIGGGTPSTIKPAMYEEIFKSFEPFLSRDAELTTEANPNSATKEWLRGMRELGINRVSFGVQSFWDEKLKLLNRSHSRADAQRAVEDAKEVGFDNISIDLIYGVAGDTKESISLDLDTAFALPITHISAYELTIEPNTPFESSPQMRVDDEDLARFVADEIESRGLSRYEVSNYGRVCRHNLGYWRLRDYIGVGAGAVGFKQDKRFYPSMSIDEYIKNPTSVRVEELDKQSLILERLFLGFRSFVGVDESLLSDEMIDRANELEREGVLRYRDGVYYCNDFFVADEVALYIYG